MNKILTTALVVVSAALVVLPGGWNQTQASNQYQPGDHKTVLKKDTPQHNQSATTSITQLVASSKDQGRESRFLAVRDQTKKSRASSQATYVKVTKSCGINYQEACLNVRSRPSTNSPITEKLRKNIILKVSDTTHNNGRLWYKVEFTDWLRYPNRVAGQWWIAGDFVKPIQARKSETGTPNTVNSDKQIIIDVSDQKLYAYENDTLFMQQAVSTGLSSFPTPRGTFPIYKMSPSRYMQGPIPGITDDSFDLPGVPWNLYFTQQGAVIHGTYWHNNFGQKWSHGCVNVPPQEARKLYKWADLGTTVVVRN